MPLVPRIAIRMARNKECRMKNERASSLFGFRRVFECPTRVYYPSSLSATACGRAFVSFQGQTRRGDPAKFGRALQTLAAQLCAIVRMIYDPGDGFPERPGVKWIEQ